MFSRRYNVPFHSNKEFSSVPTSIDPMASNRRGVGGGGGGTGGAGLGHDRAPELGWTEHLDSSTLTWPGSCLYLSGSGVA